MEMACSCYLYFLLFRFSSLRFSLLSLLCFFSIFFFFHSVASFYINRIKLVCSLLSSSFPVSPVAGSKLGSGNSDGNGNVATFSNICGMKFSVSSWSLFVADFFNNKVRQINLASSPYSVSTYAGKSDFVFYPSYDILTILSFANQQFDHLLDTA